MRSCMVNKFRTNAEHTLNTKQVYQQIYSQMHYMKIKRMAMNSIYMFFFCIWGTYEDAGN